MTHTPVTSADVDEMRRAQLEQDCRILESHGSLGWAEELRRGFKAIQKSISDIESGLNTEPEDQTP